MKLRLFGKEKGHTFVAGFGKHWHPMACDRIRWLALACDCMRWHTTASSRKPSSQCPTPKMKPNTFAMPLAIMPTTEKMACVTV